MTGGWPEDQEERNERTRCRYFLKDSIRKEFDFSKADQNLGLPPPPIQKPSKEGAMTFQLPLLDDWSAVCKASLAEVIKKRRSRRTFTDEELSLEELSFLLWATQGIKNIRQPYLRTSPSAGARHSFETYLSVGNTAGLENGLYRYLPLDHSLVLVRKQEDILSRTADACFGQSFIGTASVVFIWTAVPYRMEWRYGAAAHKVIAIDSGHVCQNLYLASEGIGCGTCGIGAYDQDMADELIEVEGEDEFVIYIAPVGRIG